MKRFVDVVAALFGLLLMAPVLVFIALAVRIDSEGPVLFRQTRVGRDGRTFQILKFRSMYHAHHGRDSGAQITAADDPRITRFGALLRRSKLDELPQLINVLRGDMSLVGPRPEVPRYVAMYPPDARAEILSVRPGITDEAAIEFRDESEILGRSVDPERTYIEEILPRKIQLYQDYVRHRSLLSDLLIILRTLRRIVVSTSNRGA